MSRSSSALLLSLLLAHVSGLVGQSQLEAPPRGTQYETMTFGFAENLGVANPFDLEATQVELLVREPDLTDRVLSFFFDGASSSGQERWEARFTPKHAGPYSFRVRVRDTVRWEGSITVERSTGTNRGGLKAASRLGVFNYEGGGAFRGIGLNVCWARDYEHYFRKMQSSGMNVARIWMCPWNLSFEWQETGLGRYNLESARRLDEILRLADQYGIYIILCIDYHGVAPKGMGFFRENRWLANPYNKANGGPCAEPADLFTSSEAAASLRRKYKYIVSRYGHSNRIAMWEFFNEADLMAGKAIPMNRWHVAMAEYVKSIDPHERLVSSSATRTYAEKLVDAFRSPAIDVVMYHHYNALDMGPYVTDLQELGNEFYAKPFVLAEFGVDYRGAERTLQVDPNHVGIHNAIWAGWFSETPIVPLSWWWDNLIEPKNLWPMFAQLSRFADSLDASAPNLRFTSLTAGPGSGTEEIHCMVRAVYAGDRAALWFKNNDYKWSLAEEGRTPRTVGAFRQDIPALVPGTYAVRWYDPQAGHFAEGAGSVTVARDGVAHLDVAPFDKDIAVLLCRR